MYYLSNFSRKNSKVKSHFRGGKLVRSFIRRIKRKYQKHKEFIKKAAIIGSLTAASVLGVSAANYKLLKARFFRNMRRAGKNMKPLADVGKKVEDTKNTIHFALGGFIGIDESNLKEAKAINIALRKSMGRDKAKTIEFVTLTHNWNYGKRGDWIDKVGLKVFSANIIKEASKPILKGINPVALEKAQEIYSWAIKNPGKKIRITGNSAGGTLAKDIKYILDNSDLPNKPEIATIAAFDVRMHKPNISKINIVSDSDRLVYSLKPRNVTYLKYSNKRDAKDNHSLSTYLENSELTKRINKALFDID